MKTCTKILMSAVMSISLGSAAWAQSSTGGAMGGAEAGSSASGNQNQTGGSAPAGGTGQTTPSDATAAGMGTGSSSTSGSASGATGTGSASTDALGSQSSDTSRAMSSAAGGADAELGQQLDKIASMPDKAPDALFALDAAKQNMFEVAFAKLAQQKSQNQQIKDMAKMVEQDHSQANDQLKQVVQKMGLTVPSSLPSEKQKMLSVYQAMSPQDFDTCFLLENKASHAKAITSYTDHQKSVKDEDLRKYVTAVLPKLKQHGMMVQQAASAAGFSAPMGGSGASGGAMGADSHGHGAHGASHGGTTTGGSGANSDPTAPANNQNPSNR